MSGPIVPQTGNGQPNSADPFCLKELMHLVLLACIGGQVGFPVAFCWRDFPLDVISAIWAWVARQFDSDKVAEVSSQADLQRLKSRLHEVRVVFVYQSRPGARFAESICWMIEQRRGAGKPLPVVMAIYLPGMEDSPGGTIVIQGSAGLSAAVGRWLLDDGTKPEPHVDQVLAPDTVPDWKPLHKAVHTAASEIAASPAAPLKLTDVRLLDALLTADWLRPTVERRRIPEQSPQVLLSAYEKIRQILQHRMLRKAGEPVDNLTHLMVSRANSLLRARAGQSPSVRANVGARTGGRSTLDKLDQIKTVGRPNSITFLELVNLGNPLSPEFQTILGFCRSDSNLLKKNGIRFEPNSPHARSPPQDRKSAGSASDSVTWSFKQARTRFERLRKSKLIEARRSAANGPYEYVLPEELRTDQSQFSHLPTVEAVQKHLLRR